LLLAAADSNDAAACCFLMLLVLLDAAAAATSKTNQRNAKGYSAMRTPGKHSARTGGGEREMTAARAQHTTGREEKRSEDNAVFVEKVEAIGSDSPSTTVSSGTP
jgi:hypothetical protein